MNLYDTFGLIGCFTACLFYSSPIIMIYTLYFSKRRVEQVSGAYLFISFLNCLLWFSIGLYLTHDNNDGLYWCNFIGLLLNFIWCVAYLNFYTEGKKMLFCVYAFTLVDIAIEFLYFNSQFLFIKEDDKEILDPSKTVYIDWIASIGFNLFMYLTPGLNFLKLFESKDHQIIAIESTVTGLVNCIVWLCYGIFDGNKANSVGGFICLCQIVIYFYFLYRPGNRSIIHKEINANNSNEACHKSNNNSNEKESDSIIDLKGNNESIDSLNAPASVDNDSCDPASDSDSASDPEDSSKDEALIPESSS